MNDTPGPLLGRLSSLFRRTPGADAPRPDPTDGSLLASRDGTGRVHIDSLGALTPLLPGTAPLAQLCWSVHAGDAWNPGTDVREQRLDAPAVVVSTHPVSGGSIDTELKLDAVIPQFSPFAARAVTTVTPVAKQDSAVRNSRASIPLCVIALCSVVTALTV